MLFMIFESSYPKKYLCDPNLACGCSMKPASLARILNGKAAVTASWGWAVSLSILGGSYLCGGSILSSSWIITAAYCVENATSLSITAYVGSDFRWSGTQNRSVPNYCKFTNTRSHT